MLTFAVAGCLETQRARLAESGLVVLDFERFDPVFGGSPEIVEVSGRKGWRHASWEWFFRQCEADLQFGFEPVRCQ